MIVFRQLYRKLSKSLLLVLEVRLVLLVQQAPLEPQDRLVHLVLQDHLVLLVHQVHQG